MNDQNYEKSKQLKMSAGKARNILVKSIMFELSKKCNMDTCYRCRDKIENIDDFTIEHKIEWLHSKNPEELFFDLNNIAFSHSMCNSTTKRHSQSKIINSNSGYKGVSFDKKEGKWKVFVWYDNKSNYHGSYKDVLEAVKVYDEIAIKFIGEKAITNKKLGLL